MTEIFPYVLLSFLGLADLVIVVAGILSVAYIAFQILPSLFGSCADALVARDIKRTAMIQCGADRGTGGTESPCAVFGTADERVAVVQWTDADGHLVVEERVLLGVD